MSEDFRDSQMLAARNVTVFQDRRKPTDTEILIGLVERLGERMDRYDQKLSDHMAQEAGEIKASIEAALHSSFPDGDPDGHRRAHEAWIKREEDRAKFWEKMKVELGKYGLIGFIGWAGYYLWQAFLKGPK